METAVTYRNFSLTSPYRHSINYTILINDKPTSSHSVSLTSRLFTKARTGWPTLDSIHAYGEKLQADRLRQESLPGLTPPTVHVVIS